MGVEPEKHTDDVFLIFHRKQALAFFTNYSSAPWNINNFLENKIKCFKMSSAENFTKIEKYENLALSRWTTCMTKF